eukprot:761222-Alexandrium_andersonii.AAC.1
MQEATEAATVVGEDLARLAVQLVAAQANAEQPRGGRAPEQLLEVLKAPAYQDGALRTPGGPN